MVVEKDQDVIVPATEYFANKNDPIVPILCESVESWRAWRRGMLPI